MMQSLAIVLGLGLLSTECSAMSAFLVSNSSRPNAAGTRHLQASYGKNSCRCIGINNLKGYFVTKEDYHHVQRPADTGASCAAWEESLHPKCQDDMSPAWCRRQWCYVDPCSCDLDVLPKQTTLGLTYQGTPAYWSYNTCGSTDFFSQDLPEACVNQKSEGACTKQPKCAWDGKQCGGKEVVETCKAAPKIDESLHGEEDCRCIGIAGRDVGKSFMHINEKELIAYPPNVGSTCQAWEGDTHPDCLKDGDKPSWCSSKWCFVDPCKCKSKSPPLAVQPANEHMQFQGKTAYWSYDTCGSTDTWTSANKGMYCVTQKTEAACNKLSKCAWDGKDCLGKALVNICAEQESTGVLAVESPFSSAPRLAYLQSFAVVIFAAVMGLQQ